MTPTQLGQAAYEAYAFRLKKLLAKKGKPLDMKPWLKVANSTKEAWIVAAAEVVHLTRPRHEVLREAALEGIITVRVEEEKKPE